MALADLSMTLKMNADAASKALPPQISSLLGERVKFSATATRDPQGAFAANSLEISSGSPSASGTGSMQGSDLQAPASRARWAMSRRCRRSPARRSRAGSISR
ncbi:hypothetical protein ACVOMV_21215 [Mesorhizobium atlanticum]